MNVALWPLRMNVVSANAARPSGAGSSGDPLDECDDGLFDDDCRHERLLSRP